jgi:hypothetical protein
MTENQLLLSDLSTSTLPSSSPLPQGSLAYPSNGSRTLLQITAIQDIGNSAWSQIEVLKDKLEERKKGGEERKYPRGMGRVKLSNGFWEVEGIEYERVEGLGLEECQLGCKVSSIVA